MNFIEPDSKPSEAKQKINNRSFFRFWKQTEIESHKTDQSKDHAHPTPRPPFLPIALAWKSHQSVNRMLRASRLQSERARSRFACVRAPKPPVFSYIPVRQSEFLNFHASEKDIRWNSLQTDLAWYFNVPVDADRWRRCYYACRRFGGRYFNLYLYDGNDYLRIIRNSCTAIRNE